MCTGRTEPLLGPANIVLGARYGKPSFVTRETSATRAQEATRCVLGFGLDLRLDLDLDLDRDRDLADSTEISPSGEWGIFLRKIYRFTISDLILSHLISKRFHFSRDKLPRGIRS